MSKAARSPDHVTEKRGRAARRIRSTPCTASRSQTSSGSRASRAEALTRARAPASSCVNWRRGSGRSSFPWARRLGAVHATDLMALDGRSLAALARALRLGRAARSQVQGPGQLIQADDHDRASGRVMKPKAMLVFLAQSGEDDCPVGPAHVPALSAFHIVRTTQPPSTSVLYLRSLVGRSWNSSTPVRTSYS